MNHDPAVDRHIVSMLEKLLGERKVILISKGEDGDYSGSASRRMSTATTLEGCIEELTDHPRRKVCLRKECVSAGKPKPLWCFGPDKDSKDRHAAVCKACEATRVGRIGKKRKKIADEPKEKPE